MSEYEEIQVLPTGVYRVRYKQISPRQIKALRTRINKKLQDLRRKRNTHLVALNELDAEMEVTQRQLEDSLKPEVDDYIQRWEAMKGEAEQRAETFLREFLGEEEYARFRENGYTEFQDINGEFWRVEKDGTAWRWEEGGRRRVCVVRQRGLPMPDHIVSVVQTIREQPDRLRNVRR